MTASVSHVKRYVSLDTNYTDVSKQKVKCTPANLEKARPRLLRHSTRYSNSATVVDVVLWVQIPTIAEYPERYR